MISQEVRENLSKYKYIYRIYKNVDNILHIECFPIIYANSDYIYYKNGRYTMLSYLIIKWKTIFDDINEAVNYIKNNFNYYNCNEIYFISNKNKKYEEEIDLSQVSLKLKEENDKLKIKKQEDKVKETKEQYERALKELEEMKNEN